MESLPNEILLLTSEYLTETDKKNLAKSSKFLFWAFWDVSSCYWNDPFVLYEDIHCKIDNDFLPFAGRSLPQKPCKLGCLGREWGMMCDKCRAYEDDYYNKLYEKETTVSYGGLLYDNIFEY